MNSTSTNNVGVTSTMFVTSTPTVSTLIQTNVFDDQIELVYKEVSIIRSWPRYNDDRVYKIIYSVVDGKWNKSDKIYGKIIPAQEEDYEFED